jgi:hypothetical protein
MFLLYRAYVLYVGAEVTTQTQTRARRRSVVVEDPDLAADYDYADCFEIELADSDTRSPEEAFRAAVEQNSWVSHWLPIVPIIHRHVLRLHLEAPSSPNQLFGWRIVKSDADVIRLEASGPLIRGVIVGRRRTRSTVTFTTFVYYVSPMPARVIWALVSPLHRSIVPYLLERAAAAGTGRDQT